jgi:hypothetical protein
MISHALTIVKNELNKHLVDIYNSVSPAVGLGNLAEGFSPGQGTSGVLRDRLYLSVVNIKEEKTLKNLPNRVHNDLTLKATYENPPVFLNLQILIVATPADYNDALLLLSRAIRFFQYRNVFTQDTVDPASITASAPVNPLDQLATFKLIFDLYSPSMEEVNHLWGTLGGKQYPFVLYMLKMLELQFKAVQRESGLITEVASDFYHKNTEKDLNKVERVITDETDI